MDNSKKLIIFSDFDGTITERDVIVMIMEKFAPPEWVEIKDKILYQRSITLKDGVERLFSLIDSKKKDTIIEFVKKESRIRAGFNELLDFCKKENIEFNVLSAGLDFFIKPVLENFKDKLNIFCNKANFKSDVIKIDYKYLPKNCELCGQCGCCKVEIIEKYPQERFKRVIIGDGLAELPCAKIADVVFATGNLIKLLEQENIPCIPFNNFYEVKKQLAQKLLQKI